MDIVDVFSSRRVTSSSAAHQTYNGLDWIICVLFFFYWIKWPSGLDLSFSYDTRQLWLNSRYNWHPIAIGNRVSRLLCRLNQFSDRYGLQSATFTASVWAPVFFPYHQHSFSVSTRIEATANLSILRRTNIILAARGGVRAIPIFTGHVHTKVASPPLYVWLVFSSRERQPLCAWH